MKFALRKDQYLSGYGIGEFFYRTYEKSHDPVVNLSVKNHDPVAKLIMVDGRDWIRPPRFLHTRENKTLS